MADVRFENITFHYGDKCILKNFSLSVEESQIMCLVGPSGCGKTTLVRCLLGFIKPETGSIYVGDKCLFSAEKKINVPPEYRHIGVVFQDYAVWPHMTVLENILYPMKKMRMNKVEMTEKARHALEQVRMVGYEKHLPSQLSGGQQQRVAIARALMTNPELLLLDEITSALDPMLVGEVLDMVAELKEQGTTILMATHEMSFAHDAADRIVLLRHGVIAENGTPQQVMDESQDPETREFFSHFRN